MKPKLLVFPSRRAALVGAVLPVSAGAPADGAEKPAFSGYSSSAWAAPVKIEIYEPTIPIPATPQAEFEMAYTKVEADSGSSAGRASWLWPGDSIGEGAKTVIENLGLPEELSGPLAAQGYPVQVNSSQPGGEATMADEPFPGTVMETSASESTTIAQTGFSPDGDVHAPADGDGKGGGGKDGGAGTPGVPGLPEIPGLPALPGLSGVSGSPTDALQDFGQAITGTSVATADDPADDPAPTTPGAPGIPPELAALVDFEGYTSSSQNVASADKVVTSSRSALGDVQLLGGLITLDGVVVTSTSSSDGKTGRAHGKASLGGMTIAGQAFTFGPDGFEAAGQHTDIPGLPDQADQALAQLGVKLILPKPTLQEKGDQATSEMAGLRIQVDVSTLRKKLDALPLQQLVDTVPDQAGQLKTPAPSGDRAVAAHRRDPRQRWQHGRHRARHRHPDQHPRQRPRLVRGRLGWWWGRLRRRRTKLGWRAVGGRSGGHRVGAVGRRRPRRQRTGGLGPAAALLDPRRDPRRWHRPRRRRRHLAPQGGPARPRWRRLLHPRPRQRPSRPPKGLTMTTVRPAGSCR